MRRATAAPSLRSTPLSHAGLLRLQPVQSTGRNTLQTARLGFPPPDVEGQGGLCCWHNRMDAGDGLGSPHGTDKLAFRTVARRPVSADGHATNKDTCSLPRRRFALLVARPNGSWRCRLSAPTGCQAGPVLSPIKPTEQPPRFPGTLAHRALRETPITFPARFTKPSSSVSTRGQRPARRRANGLRRYPHHRMVNLPVRSPANDFSRRFTALTTRSVFALHQCAQSTCQNDK